MPDILHFTGQHDFDREQIIGPDFGRRYLMIRRVDYDPVANISPVRLRGLMPDELQERIKPLIAGQTERERIRKVFNG